MKLNVITLALAATVLGALSANAQTATVIEAAPPPVVVQPAPPAAVVIGLGATTARASSAIRTGRRLATRVVIGTVIDVVDGRFVRLADAVDTSDAVVVHDAILSFVVRPVPR